MAALMVLGGGTLLAAQVQTDLEQGVQARTKDLQRPDQTPPLKLNEIKLPSDLPLDIPPGAEFSPDLSKLTLPEGLDLAVPHDLDLSDLQFELPQDFTLQLPEGTVFSPPGLQLPEGASIRLPDGREFKLPAGSNLDLPPELIDRLRAQGVTPGRLNAPRSIDVRDLPPELTASLDPPQFDGSGRLALPPGTTITLPDGRQFPFPAGVIPYSARYLLPAGTRIDLPVAEEMQQTLPVPRPNSTTQLVPPEGARKEVLSLQTEITSMPSRVRKGEPIVVSGYVRDPSGRPVAGAPVDIFMNETKRAPGVLVGTGASDATGTFTITLTLPNDKPAREYQLVNHAVGFTDRNGRTWGDGWGDPPFTTYAATTLTLTLPSRDGLGASTPIAGTLVDNTGAPVAGAAVTVSADGGFVARPLTDAQGRFSTTHVFDAPGDHVVQARFLGSAHYEGSAATASILIDDYAIEVAPTLRAQPGETVLLAGRVLGKGAVAPERPVEIGFFGTSVTLTTDSTGRFSYAYAIPPSQAPGLYQVRYALPEQNVVKTQPLELNLTGRLALSAPPTWDVEQPLPVSVTLTTREGAAIAGQQIRLVLTGPGGTSETFVSTDGGGAVNVELRPLRPTAGAYALTARADGNPYLQAPAAATPVALGQFSVLWSVPSTVIRGEDASGAVTVRFADRPFAGASVTLDFFGPRQLVTDGNGRATWSYEVPASAALGERVLSLAVADHPTRTTVTKVVAVPDLRVEVPSSFTPGAPVDVHLRLYDDKGAPLRDREVTLTTIGADAMAHTVVRTNAAGEWRGPVNVTSEDGNVTLSARFDGADPYLGADSAQTMTAAPPTVLSKRSWLVPALVVGLAALAGGGTWYAVRNLPRKARGTTALATAATPLAATLRAPDFDVRFDIPEDEPQVWGVGEPLAIVARDRGRGGELELAWSGGAARLGIPAGGGTRTTLTFPEEGEVTLVARRVDEAEMEAARASVRIVDYRKETAREFDLFLEKARRIDPSLTTRSTPREIGWTLAGRLGEEAAPKLDEIALVMEVTNYSQYVVTREHYLRFVRAARALDPSLDEPSGG